MNVPHLKVYLYCYYITLYDSDKGHGVIRRVCQRAPGRGRLFPQRAVNVEVVAPAAAIKRGGLLLARIDPRTQLLGDYGHERCRWQPVDLTGPVVGDRLSVGTGWRESTHAGDSKRINCDGASDGDELGWCEQCFI